MILEWAPFGCLLSKHSGGSVWSAWKSAARLCWSEQGKGWQFLEKLKIELAYDLAMTLLCIYSEELKTGC